ncbi:MAG: hypothetical protein OXC60_14320 [Litoreibacter sp.]|nr:hypothetical protein [Litoreibacter sp.]
MSDAFREQMDDPCQWSEDVLPDEEFYGRWRGWVDAKNKRQWPSIAPVIWRDVEPIPAVPGCEWKTDPIVPEDVSETVEGQPAD